MKREDLLYKLTGTESPGFMTERENVMINKFLEILDDFEQEKLFTFTALLETYKTKAKEYKHKLERFKSNCPDQPGYSQIKIALDIYNDIIQQLESKLVRVKTKDPVPGMNA